MEKLSVGEFSVKLHDRSEVEEVDAHSWNDLAANSIYANPFYERWNLMPALRHLDKNQKIYIVTILDSDNRLVGLFPVAIEKWVMHFSILSVWKHDHCYLTDPLLLSQVNVVGVLDRLCKELSLTWCSWPWHSPELIPSGRKRTYKYLEKRAAILNTESIDSHLASLSGKKKREHGRVLRRAKELNGQLIYEEHNNINDGLNRYTQLEKSGWKGRNRSAILSEYNTYNYYQEIAKNCSESNTIEFQVLRIDDVDLAVAFRFVSGNRYFEVKTAYNEEFRNIGPGKILELEILKKLSLLKDIQVDSCTSPNNYLINTLWPERKLIQTTHIFLNSWLSGVLALAYSLRSRLRNL